MGSFPRSYEYGKIRVRLMRTEGVGNENEGGSFPSGRGSLRSRAEGGGVCLYHLFRFRAGKKVGTLNACKEI